MTTGQGDQCITSCLLDYSYFKENYKMIVIDLSQQQVLDVDPKTIQKNNFTGNLDLASTIFFIIREAKETIINFSQRNAKVLQILFVLI